MNTFKYKILTILLVVAGTSLYGQISIPYGNDAILNDDTTRIDLRFELDGRDWDCRYVSYIFLNGTNDIAGVEEHEAVRRAFASWSGVTNLDFIEACNENDADIRIAWEVDDHGDPCTIPENCFFDGEGGTLAHGFFPPPNTGAFAGDVHFDDDEDWSLDDDIDMETVALHEIGHALGLRHSDVNNSVMEAVYEGERRNLTQDDRDGIREIYGNRENPIIGPNLICNTANYSLDDFDCLNEDFTITWIVSGNLNIIQGQGTGNIEVEENIGFSGQSGFIRVSIDSGCDELLFTKSVWIGRPLLPNFNVDIDPCRNLVRIIDQNYNYNSNPDYEFIISVECNGKKRLYFRDGQPLTLHLPFKKNCIICIEAVFITNSCGSTFDDRIQCYTVPECRGFEGYKIKAYPNPVSNMLYVELLAPEIIDYEKGMFVIFNSQGEEITSFQATSRITTFAPNSRLEYTDNFYIRYISDDGHSNTEKLIFIE